MLTSQLLRQLGQLTRAEARFVDFVNVRQLILVDFARFFPRTFSDFSAHAYDVRRDKVFLLLVMNLLVQLVFGLTHHLDEKISFMIRELFVHFLF